MESKSSPKQNPKTSPAPRNVTQVTGLDGQSATDERAAALLALDNAFRALAAPSLTLTKWTLRHAICRILASVTLEGALISAGKK